VKGILLIDSPSPIDHVPLTSSVISSAVGRDVSSIPRPRLRHSVSDNIALLVHKQFEANTALLQDYCLSGAAAQARQPDEEKGLGTQSRKRINITLLRSEDGYQPEGIQDVPAWLADRSNPDLASAGWRAVAGAGGNSEEVVKLDVVDIPGHHFEAFHPRNVRVCICPSFFSSNQLLRLTL
jgi:hypothetical protein